ncbi:hypothetical protein CYLTODRAFT_379149 [Cylindrobasidium torrendii FP15055 ss-10]|uniref:PH domain-containing protein n=1 Tax=Cylindrobasidium torrendii FP15055 ss-10 TaxID=1314674 RepID=A0A0D7B5Y3_9AGAR|nr:hypothetical protein CYLTODRAFT_379149 [Cylindrobasidium torrendii FP15055 ss-10]
MASSSSSQPDAPGAAKKTAASFSSPSELLSHLEGLLDAKEAQLQHAATFGQRVLAQRMELDERVRQLREEHADELDDERDLLDEDLAEKYKELADTLMLWDKENAEMSREFLGSEQPVKADAPLPEPEPEPEEVNQTPERNELSDMGTGQPERARTSAAAQSRRAKNAAHRADDVEFAFEIGSGLLNEVRRLQSLLGERDKAIQDMKEEKDDIESMVESLRKSLKQQEKDGEKYKEENWNLEVQLQEMRHLSSEAQSEVSRLNLESKRLAKQLAATSDIAETFKTENSQLQHSLDELTAKHETDVALARKHAAGLARDKSDLQQAVDKLKAEQERAGRRFGRFGSPATPGVMDSPDTADDFLSPGTGTGYDDPFGSIRSRRSEVGGEPLDMDEDLSPEQSPVAKALFLSPNHPANEIEALKQKLAHAHRQIATLKNSVIRDRSAKRDSSMVMPEESIEVHDEDESWEEEPERERSPSPSKRASVRKPLRPARGRGQGRHHYQRSVSSVQFQGADDDELLDDAEEEDPFNEDAETSLASRRTSVEGMDPIFANVLKRTPSTSSVPPNTSPLHQSILRRAARGGTIRRRGGAAFQDGRPASLIGQPEDLAAAFGGMDSISPYRGDRDSISVYRERDSIYEVSETEYVDFACQAGAEEEATDADKTTAEAETTVLAPVSAPIETSDVSMQTEEEPKTPAPITSDISIGTDPIEEPIPVATSNMSTETVGPLHVQIEVQTDAEQLPVSRAALSQRDIAAWSLSAVRGVPRPRVVSTATDITVRSPVRRTFLGESHEEEEGEATGTGDSDYEDARAALSSVDESRSLHDALQTPLSSHYTTADPFTPTDEQRNSMAFSMSTSQEDFHSMMTMTDNEFSGDEAESEDSDGESIKASQIDTPTSEAAPLPVVAAPVYASKAIEVHLVDEPAVPIRAPSPQLEEVKAVPLPVQDRLPLVEKPEVKEMEIQTDTWEPPAPAPLPVPTPAASVSAGVQASAPTFVAKSAPAPVPASAPPTTMSFAPTGMDSPTTPTPAHTTAAPANLAALAAASPAFSAVAAPTARSPNSHQFMFIAPPKDGIAHTRTSSTTDESDARPNGGLFRETSNGFAAIRNHRTSTDSNSRRQSIESALSSIYDEGPTPKAPAVAKIAEKGRATPLDKTRPPTMTLPPPPRAPPPPGSMPPPSFIPERRAQTLSSGSRDTPPPRPLSPPPPELIQRATTPTFQRATTPTFGLGIPQKRQHGSSMPPMHAGLRDLPSTSSFRSAAHAANNYGYAREMSSTSLVSDRSPRSSMSSDRHSAFLSPNPPRGTPAPLADPFSARPRAANAMDPAVIHAITQTMIGEFLYKYTRKTIGKGHGQSRHKRFFWVHPYTRTLNWQEVDPQNVNVAETTSKSAFVEGVRSVLDPNPMPPGLYQYSVVVSTPQREMKITCPTKERHDIWMNSLKYLLSRPKPTTIASPGSADIPFSDNEEGFSDDGHERGQNLMASPQSQRSSRWNITPRGKRSRSQLSTRTGAGSMGRRSGTPAAEYMRWGPESPYSPTRSFVDVPFGGDDPDLDLDFELHGAMSDEEADWEGLENVRACCDGRHTVGRGQGKHHHHHHHHHKQKSDGAPTGSRGGLPSFLEPGKDERPASPGAWSFKSTGSTSKEGGLFGGWGSKFGSRRSTKTPVPPS